jgi:Short chain fatty acid transporter
MSQAGTAHHATLESQPTSFSTEGVLATAGATLHELGRAVVSRRLCVHLSSGRGRRLGGSAEGAAPATVAKTFGDGFWNLITFAMQMAIVAIIEPIGADAVVVQIAHPLEQLLAKNTATARPTINLGGMP